MLRKIFNWNCTSRSLTYFAYYHTIITTAMEKTMRHLRFLKILLPFDFSAEFLTFNDQCSHHIETSQLICRVNQLTGFYMMRTLVAKRLKYKSDRVLRMTLDIGRKQNARNTLRRHQGMSIYVQFTPLCRGQDLMMLSLLDGRTTFYRSIVASSKL